MAIPKFKRKDTGMDYIDNAIVIQKDVLDLASKLPVKWAGVYQESLAKYALRQADLVIIANSFSLNSSEDYYFRSISLKMARASLKTLERRVIDIIEILYSNPVKLFCRKNGKSYTYAEAVSMLNNKLTAISINFDRQYNLIKGVLDSDKKKAINKKINVNDDNNEELTEKLVSKLFTMFFE